MKNIKSHKAYRNWNNIINNKKGITVEKEWIDSFKAFVFDMGDKPKGAILARIDKTKGFVFGNTIWKTKGEKNNITKHPLYLTWRNIINRTTSKSHPNYLINKQRGVVVCDEWMNSFEQFVKDVGDKPSKGRLKRYNVMRNYDKDNCYWYAARGIDIKVRDVVKRDNSHPNLF